MRYSASLTFLYILFLFSCEQDANIIPKPYPIVITNEVFNIDSSGATLSAKLVNTGNQKITSYGFILKDENQEYSYNLEVEPGTSTFQFHCKVDILPDQNYIVKAYVTTREYNVFGNAVSFIGQGSSAPRIVEFKPNTGFDGERVSIICNNLSSIPDNNQVFLNETLCELESIHGDTIHIITPKMSYHGNAKFKILVNNQFVISKETFHIKGPVVSNITPLTGKSGSYILVKGYNLTQNGNEVNLSFEDGLCRVIAKTDTLVLFTTPAFALYSQRSFEIAYSNGLKTTHYPQKYLMEKSWEDRSPTPFDWHSEYKSFSYNNMGYIFEYISKQLYKYDPLSNNWSAVLNSTFPGERHEYSQYIIYKDKLYKVGGFNYLREKLPELWVYNFMLEEWTRKDNIPFSFRDAVYFILNEKIYLITGERQFWHCDFEQGNYIQLNDFPEWFNYSFASSFVANNTAFVNTYGTTYQYNILNDKWTVALDNPFLPESFQEAALGFSYNGTGYVLQAGNELYKYDYVNNRWLEVSNHPYGRHAYKTVFVINDKAYFASIHSPYVGDAPRLFSFED